MIHQAPWWLRWYSICPQCGRPGFDPWVGKILWRRKWQPTPVFLPGKFRGRKSLVGYSPWGRKESDVTERLHHHHLWSKSEERRLAFKACKTNRVKCCSGRWLMFTLHTHEISRKFSVKASQNNLSVFFMQVRAVRPKVLMRLSKTKKHVSRAYGGSMCAKCVRDR